MTENTTLRVNIATSQLLLGAALGVGIGWLKTSLLALPNWVLAADVAFLLLFAVFVEHSDF